MAKRYAAFLRAVNVGGTGKLPMADLRDLCAAAGFDEVSTYIASGNVALTFDGPPEAVKAALEAQLLAYAGKPVVVQVRSGPQLAALLAGNPFADAAGNRVIVMLFDRGPTDQMIAAPKGQADEELALGQREIYVHFPTGQGVSKLEMPGAKEGTGRNLNTLAKMARLTAG